MWSTWWTLSTEHKWTVGCCSKETQWDAGLQQDGITSTGKSSLYPTWHSWGHIWILCWFGPYCEKRCGQAAEDPEKDHKEDQKTGRPVTWGKAVKTGFVQPWKKKPYGRAYQHVSVPKGCLQRRQRLLFHRVTWKRKGVMVKIILEETIIRREKLFTE